MPFHLNNIFYCFLAYLMTFRPHSLTSKTFLELTDSWLFHKPTPTTHPRFLVMLHYLQTPRDEMVSRILLLNTTFSHLGSYCLNISSLWSDPLTPTLSTNALTPSFCHCFTSCINWLSSIYWTPTMNHTDLDTTVNKTKQPTNKQNSLHRAYIIFGN